MKTTTIMVWLFLIMGNHMTLAQVDLMDALRQTAEQHNEARGDVDESNAPEELTPQQQEWQRQWEAEWQAQQSAEFLNALDTKYLKCLAMMEMFVHAYLKLVNEHKLGDLSMSECDAYGIQTLALASSTMIMYCPEGMRDGELNENQRAHLVLEYSSTIYKKEPLWSIHRYLNRQYGHWIRSAGVEFTGDILDYHNYIAYLMGFFRPRYIVPRTLEIAREMEALGCSG